MMNLVPLNNNDIQVHESFNIISYIRDFCSVMVADLPSPFSTAEEQMKQCMELPTKKDISKFDQGRRKFDYIDIGDIELSLANIFGPNWNDFPIPPGHVTEILPAKTSGGETKIMIHLDIVLVVRWANGRITPYLGRGSGMYLPESATANLSFAKSTARAEALKNAARHLGPRFGMSLKSLVESGQISDMSHLDAFELIKGSVGDRIIVSNGKPDQVVTEEILRDMSSKYFGAEDIEDLQGAAMANMARMIKEMPSVSDKINMIARLRADGVIISMEDSYSKVSNEISRLDDKIDSALP